MTRYDLAVKLDAAVDQQGSGIKTLTLVWEGRRGAGAGCGRAEWDREAGE